MIHKWMPSILFIMQIAKEMKYYKGNTSVKIHKYIFDVLTTIFVAILHIEIR